MAGSQDLSSDQLPVLQRLAGAHLPSDVAARWLRLARPAVHLLTRRDAGGDPAYDALPLVGRLGGTPEVPPGFVWPVWEGHGPLPLVAEVDLTAVAAASLDPGIALPRSGRLLAFYYDGPFLQDPDGIVLADEPPSMAGMRLVHLDDDPDARVVAEVPGLHVYPETPLRGRQAWSHPSWEDPALAAAFDADEDADEDADDWGDHPVNDESFAEALDVLRAPGLGPDDVHHQLGGWAQHVQAAVEHDVADDPLRWRPVLQVGASTRVGPPPGADEDFVDVDDSAGFDEHGFMIGMPATRGVVEADDGMDWGDLGALYWLARDDDLPGLADVRFTWQCG